MKYFIRITPSFSKADKKCETFVEWIKTYQHYLITSNRSLQGFTEMVKEKLNELTGEYPDLSQLTLERYMPEWRDVLHVFNEDKVHTVCILELTKVSGEFSYIDEEQQPKGGES